MKKQLIKISEAAKIIRVSVDTLRRWDKAGKLMSVRRPSGHRYYNLEDVNNYLVKAEIRKSDLFLLANRWVSSDNVSEPNELFYCPNNSVFLARLTRLSKDLLQAGQSQDLVSLLLAISGEIGDNSFAHNIGNWPDIVGIFFGYDVDKKEIVLADRGRGVYATLKRVKPELADDEEALRVAFTEIISGRAPEERGNGLKFVRNIVANNDLSLYFKSGTAQVEIEKRDGSLEIRQSGESIQGCLAMIKF